jgi:hypothetical protein
MSQTIRVFQAIPGTTNLFQHAANQVHGAHVPIVDDIVYQRVGRQYRPTTKTLRCHGCAYRLSACHCAPPSTQMPLERIVAMQRDLGLR